MAKHTPKPAPLTRADQDLRERQRLVARGALGGKPPKPVSVGKAAAGNPVTEQNQGVTAAVDEFGRSAADLVHPTPRFTFPPLAEPAPAPPPPAPGTYRTDQLGLCRCRFATTPHGAASHRFCGARTEIGPGNIHGSWCAEHLPLVSCMPGRTPGGASKADLIVKEVVA